MAGSTTSSVSHVVLIVAAAVRFAFLRTFTRSPPSQHSIDVEGDLEVKERLLEQEHGELSVHGPLHTQPAIGVQGHSTTNIQTSCAGLDRLVADWQVGAQEFTVSFASFAVMT